MTLVAPLVTVQSVPTRLMRLVHLLCHLALVRHQDVQAVGKHTQKCQV